MPQTDPFIDLCGATWAGLKDAARECGWIADGGDPTASQSDRDEANARENEYRQKASDVADKNLAYLAKRLSVTPPSDADLEAAKKLSMQLAAMTNVSVKVTAVINAASSLFELFSKAV